jgi:dTMP kinase
MSTFIVLDGPDGTGTTTHTKLLVERLQNARRKVVMTAEPTDGPVGVKIREELKKGGMDPMSLQLLFTTDRAWHVHEVIQPALDRGEIVVCDRYWYSTIVYAEAQGLDSDALLHLNEKFIQPDVAIFTMPPIEVSLARVAKRANKDIFEKEELQKKIHAGYLALSQGRNNIVNVDTSGEKQAGSDAIWKIVEKYL